jgi:alpha-tubulin suppressor-like RCC1 family protein
MLGQRLWRTTWIVLVVGIFQGCSDDTATQPLSDQVADILLDYPQIDSEPRDYLLPGDMLQLTAQPLDSAGDAVEGVPLTWSSSNESVLTVSPSGQLTGVALGDAVITVQAGAEQASRPFVVLAPVASVEILPAEIALVPGGAAEIQFVLKDAAGQPLSARTLTINTTNSAVAAVTQLFSVLELRAGSVGTATLEFEREGKTAQLEVQVAPVQLDTVDASGGRACGLTSDGTAWCWGTNSTGALGYGISTISSIEGSGWTPIRVSSGHQFSQITLGNSHTCALTADGSAYCWGNNGTGALGVNDLPFAAAPVAVSGGLRFSQISASYAYTCGVTMAGGAYCWGNNDVGQLGDGTTTQRFTPVPVNGGLTFTRVSSRWADQFAATTCGLTPGGAAYCWGAGFESQTGAPVAVPGGHTFVELSAGGSHSCGIEVGGAAYCWGLYGNGDTTPDLVPGGLQWRSISVLADHSCGVTASNAAYCWGDNSTGQLGDGTIDGSGETPVAVAGGLAFQSISAALGFTCGRTVQGLVYCWGEGTSGQLGQNTLENQLSPARVVGQP